MGKHATKLDEKYPVEKYRKVPLDSKGKTGRTVFAYLRRSTNKKSQEESIETQNKRVFKLAKKLGYTEKEVQVFEDVGFSGFSEVKTRDGKIETRKRKGFTALLNAIKAIKEPCILLVNNYSRLARNADDGGVIIELLGHKGNAQKIEAIYFCIGGDVWDRDTKKTHMQDCFNQAEEESEIKSEYMRANIEDNLERGVFPPMTPTPPGLKATRHGLEETESMRYVREAMKMKIAGKILKEIESYLRSHSVKTAYANLTKTIFTNTLYIGEYTEKNGNYYDNLKFVSGKPAIEREFFMTLQQAIGKKGGGYGAKQKGDVIAPLLRWTEDKDASFSVDIQKGGSGKGCYTNYKTNAFPKSSISQKKVLNFFMREGIPRIITILHYVYRKSVMRALWSQELTYEKYTKLIHSLEDRYYHILQTNGTASIEELLKAFNKNYKYLLKEGEVITEDNLSEISQRLYISDLKEFLSGAMKDEKNNLDVKQIGKQKALEIIRDSLYSTERFDTIRDTKELRKGVIKEKEVEKRRLEEEKKTQEIRWMREGFSKEQIDSATQSILDDIRNIELNIQRYSEKANLEVFLDRIPEVFEKIIELIDSIDSNADIDTMKGDLLLLLQITTFELPISTKKELQIKLLDGIESLTFISGAPDKNRTCV